MQPSYSSRSMASKRSAFDQRNPLLRVPIVVRLFLGFLIPAIIASTAAGAIGIQSSQMLTKTSGFYQSLFGNYTLLVSGDDDLQQMALGMRSFINDWRTSSVARQAVYNEQSNLETLTTNYNTILQTYLQKDLLAKHPDQVAFFSQAGHTLDVTQEQTFANTTLQTWQNFVVVENTIFSDLKAERINDALTVQRSLGRTTVANAQNALHALMQHEQHLVLAISAINNIQQERIFIITALATILAFIAIVIIGWLISTTLVPRLLELRRVALLVKKGEFQERADIFGQDEITEVAIALNNMLDQTVGLLEETRRQRDTLLSAAERLYSDMSIASGRSPRFTASTNSDPAAMLTSAFSRTTGRFRHFALHVQEMTGQIESLVRYIQDRANRALLAAQKGSLSTPMPDTGGRDALGSGGEQTTAILAQQMLTLAERLTAIIKEVQADVASFQGEDATTISKR
jgi:HAMP domain-containing protein